jgi:hypothetical protein
VARPPRPHPLPSSFQVEGWTGQLERLRRWHQRVLAVRRERSDQLTNADLDTVYAFFQSAYHLRDWMKNDSGAPVKDLEQLMRDTPSLRICRDLCNGSKHLVVTRPSVDSRTSLLREYVPGPVGTRDLGSIRHVVIAGGKHDLWALIDDCMAAWESFVARQAQRSDD